MAGFDPIGAIAQAGQNIGRLFGIGGGPPRTQIPEAPDVDAELRPSGEALVEELKDTSERQFAAEEEDKARADELAATVESDKEETVRRTEVEQTELREDKEDLDTSIGLEMARVATIPGKVQTEFANIHATFGKEATEALGRTDVQREEALAGVSEGQSAAMQAAVQGIQGNINNAVAAIQSNPNLTEAQKASMIAQTQLQGASAMAPAIGATIFSFTELAASTAVSFGQIAGGLESVILGVSGGILQAGGTAFAQAQTAVAEITTNLLSLQANSDVAYSAAQNQLLTTRSMAENGANQVMTALLPMQNTPYLDITGSLATQYQLDTEILYGGFQLQLQEAGLQFEAEAFAAENSPLGNIAEFAMSVFQAFAPG